MYHRRRRRRAGTCEIDSCEIAGILGGTAQGRFLVKCICGICEDRWLVRTGLRFVKVRVKHNVRSMPYGPTDGFWISPAFVADRDTENHGACMKDTATKAWCVGALFGGIDLNLVLKTGN